MLPIHFHHDDERKRKRPQLVDNSGWKYRSSTATAAASTLFPALISPLRIEKTLIERSSKSFLFPKGRSLFYHNVISYCTLIYPPRIRARPIGPTRESAWLSLARSKVAKYFKKLIVPASPQHARYSLASRPLALCQRGAAKFVGLKKTYFQVVITPATRFSMPLRQLDC